MSSPVGNLEGTTVARSESRAPEGATPANETDAVVDFQQLVERCLGNLAFAERVLASFEKRFWNEVAEIERAMAEGNGSAAARVAHRLKGAASNISATGLQKILLGVEQSADCGDLGRARLFLNRLSSEWDRFTEFRRCRC